MQKSAVCGRAVGGEGQRPGEAPPEAEKQTTVLLPCRGFPHSSWCPCSPDVHFSGMDLHDPGPGLLIGHRELNLSVQAA